METVILHLDLKNKSAKLLKDLIEELSRGNKSIKMEPSPYDPDFVKLVKKSAASKKWREVDAENIWESIK